MEKENVFKDVNNIFINILDDEHIALNPNDTANNVEGWDSLTHIQLVVAMEKHFHIRFTSKEIQSWNNVGEMLQCICSKL